MFFLCVSTVVTIITKTNTVTNCIWQYKNFYFNRQNYKGSYYIFKILVCGKVFSNCKALNLKDICKFNTIHKNDEFL